MTKHLKILNQIRLIRESHPKMVDIFSEGSCMNLFCILHSIYPEAEAWYDQDHIITKIDNKFYDITGVVRPEGYTPFVSWYGKDGLSKAFKQMYNGVYNITNNTTTSDR